MTGSLPDRPSYHFLEPYERISEVLFGLIMVLTFTCSISAAEAQREDIRTMLFGALGCNLAWGIIDAIMYLMACMSERGREITMLRAVRRASDPEEGRQVIAGELPSVVASVLQPGELERLRQRVRQLPEPPPRGRLGKDEWLGAVAVFLWVFIITFPVVIPFVFMQDTGRALRISNLIAITLLFLAGYSFGRIAGLRPWWTGFVMVVLSSALVAVTIALGG